MNFMSNISSADFIFEVNRIPHNKFISFLSPNQSFIQIEDQGRERLHHMRSLKSF